MKIVPLIIAFASLTTIASAQPAASGANPTWESTSFPVKGPSAPSALPAIMKFINKAGPRDTGGIVGTIINVPMTHDYTVYLWVRDDHSGVQWSAPSGLSTDSDMMKMIQYGLEARQLALIGVIRGAGGDTLYAAELERH